MILKTCAYVSSALTLCVACGAHAASPVTVLDSSFENVLAAATPEVVDGPSPWRFAWGGGFASLYESPSPLYPNQDGDYLGNVFLTEEAGFAALYQDVVTIQEGTYKFTLGVGHEPDAEPSDQPFRINFEATGNGPTTLVQENTYPLNAFDSDGLTDITAEVTFAPGHPEIGRKLRPVLLASGPDAGTNPEDPRASYMMDNARLEFTPTGGPDEMVRVGQHSFDPLDWNLAAGTNANATQYRPEEPLFASQDSDQLGALTVRGEGGWGAAFYQDTTTIEEGVYSLTVGVAHDPEFEPTSAPFQINFESVAANGAVTLLGENVFPVGSASSTDLTDLTAMLSIPSGLPNVGETLRLVLLTTGTDAGSNTESDDPRAIYLLDNVRLEFEAATGGVLVGDFNDNGVVDAADFTVWRDNLGAGDESSINNAGDGLGGVDMADYDLWVANFGDTAEALAVSAPEPAALSLLLLFGASWALRRRQ
ncbi:hypothetical protein Mal64_07670 [Pseudobythopirellula maris]|uniref:PEP-CTERM protein-sorting domain-containing protein n=1 Tax=Pseudobythopirellula maris TaxID=2527991 RepID=A0A5C5ZTM8_9BACT|nr:hypothetical protein [Pseudobythopirellula maris]TWT90378.1 hypothetical protein Mal64_07670 [Pseudobythopirellula maris]